MKGETLDMLSRRGLTRRLVWFSLPIIASGIVQQSFNAVDVAVVGRFVSSGAVAAVGANGPVISLIINLFIGIAIGANVVLANYIGQKNNSGATRAVATTGALALVSGFGIMVVALAISEPILRMLKTPDDILPEAVRYLRIFSLGLPAMMVYNFLSATLRSVGDTRRPFYWLVAGGIVNVVLNLIFVLIFGMGVEGVAIATVASNVVSAIGVSAVMMREREPLVLRPRNLRFHHTELAKILRIGVPAGIQGMVFALSNVFIQSGINSFGREAMAGSAAALNFELYCYFVVSAFAQAATAFISQNYGAGHKENCRTICSRCLWLGMGSCAILNLIFFLWRYDFVGIFIPGEEAIRFGAIRMSYVLLLQFLATSYEVTGAAMRALGYSMTPTVLTILGTCLLRVMWVSGGRFAEFQDLLIIYPITWIATGTSVVTAYLIVARKVLGPPVSGASTSCGPKK